MTTATIILTVVLFLISMGLHAYTLDKLVTALRRIDAANERITVTHTRLQALEEKLGSWAASMARHDAE